MFLEQFDANGLDVHRIEPTRIIWFWTVLIHPDQHTHSSVWNGIDWLREKERESTFLRRGRRWNCRDCNRKWHCSRSPCCGKEHSNSLVRYMDPHRNPNLSSPSASQSLAAPSLHCPLAQMKMSTPPFRLVTETRGNSKMKMKTDRRLKLVRLSWWEQIANHVIHFVNRQIFKCNYQNLEWQNYFSNPYLNCVKKSSSLITIVW